MAAIAWPDVIAIAPQLTTVPVAAQTLILGYVNSELEADYFGGEDSFTCRLARVFLAAHFGEIQRRRGQLGIVTSERIGAEGIDINYMSRLVGEALQETPYGEQYQFLVDSSPARTGFVT